MIKLVDGIASSLILIHVGKVLKRWHWKEGVAPVATTGGGSAWWCWPRAEATRRGAAPLCFEAQQPQHSVRARRRSRRRRSRHLQPGEAASG